MLERLLKLFKSLLILGTLSSDSTLEISIITDVAQFEECPLFTLNTADEVIEDVEVSFANCWGLRYAGSFKVVLDSF